MEGRIKILDSTFPVTVINAVAVGDGTNKMLPEYLNETYPTLESVKDDYDATSEDPISGKGVAAALLDGKYVSAQDTQAGQIPIANGDGTITWTTIENARGVNF